MPGGLGGLKKENLLRASIALLLHAALASELGEGGSATGERRVSAWHLTRPPTLTSLSQIGFSATTPLPPFYATYVALVPINPTDR
jgi:hypothetical protein